MIGDIGSAVLGLGSAGLPPAGCNGNPALEQCGTATCTIPSSATPGNQACLTTVNFPIAFPSVPVYANAQFAGLNSSTNHNERTLPAFSIPFQADSSETWAAFPAALTEIYGTTDHEPEVGIEIQDATVAQFVVTCTNAAGAQTGTEILRPQYFDSGSGTWKELATNAGALDVNVGSLFCGFAGSDAGIAGPAAFTSALVAGTQLRVVGLGGSGVGDSLSFNNIFLLFYITVLQVPSLCIQITSACPSGEGFSGTPISKTQMAITCNIAFPHPTSSFKCNIVWDARVA